MKAGFLLVASLFALLSGLAMLAPAQEPLTAAAGEGLFRDKVAPVLRQSCLPCHNPAKSRGSLDLSTRATALEGGEKGPAIVPGDAQKSLLLQMVRGPQPKMPQKGEALTAGQVVDVGRWIDAGAPWPKDVAPGSAEGQCRRMVVAGAAPTAAAAGLQGRVGLGP